LILLVLLFSCIQGCFVNASSSRRTFHSKSLESDAFGLSCEQTCLVLVPGDYNDTEKRYPVVYFLHGFSTGINFFDGIFAGIETNDVIIVVVSGLHPIVGGTFYANTHALGDWETHVAHDTVRYIDESYRTINGSIGRGIAGFSMGGYSALTIAMKYPDVFGSVLAMSPGLFEPGGIEDTEMFTDSVKEHVTQLCESLESSEDKTLEFTRAMNRLSPADIRRFTIAYGIAFSSESSSEAPFLIYPYRKQGNGYALNSGELSSWERNGFGGIEEKIEKYGENLRSLRAIGIEYGRFDSYSWIPRGCEHLSNTLSERGIEHQLTTSLNAHSGSLENRIRDTMIPFFVQAFSEGASEASEPPETAEPPGIPGYPWGSIFIGLLLGSMVACLSKRVRAGGSPHPPIP